LTMLTILYPEVDKVNHRIDKVSFLSSGNIILRTERRLRHATRCSRIMRILRLIPLAAVVVATLIVATPSANTPETASLPMTVPSNVQSNDSVTSVRAVNDNNVADDQRLAEETLKTLQARYQYLDDVTVSMGSTPNDEQAIAYYTEGEIVISSDHVTGIETILAHEVWHVIDWRDNGRLDWGEDLPPDNSYTYVRS